MNSYLLHFILFLSAVAMAYFLTPVIEKLAIKIGAYDIPTERKVHREPVPRLGGIAIFISFVVVAVIFVAIRILMKSHTAADLLANNKEIIGVISGATFAFLFGCLDDIFEITAKFKFLGQFVAALIVLSFGVTVTFIGNPFGGGLISFPEILGYNLIGAFITMFWIIGLTNAFNFIDGLDGLASGVGIIAISALYFSAIQAGKINIAILLVILGGTLLGFLRFNFNPAKIFMGDSGTMFVGFFLGSVTVLSAAKSTAALALLVPIVIMGVPIFDTAYAIWRRFINKKPLSVADKEHIHHRLLRKGFSHKKAVLIIYAWTALLSGVGISLALTESGFVKLVLLFVFVVVTFMLARYTGLFDWFLKVESRKEEHERNE